MRLMKTSPPEMRQWSELEFGLLLFLMKRKISIYRGSELIFSKDCCLSQSLQSSSKRLSLSLSISRHSHLRFLQYSKKLSQVIFGMLSVSRSSSPSRLTRLQGNLKNISNSNLSVNLGAISQSRSINKRDYTRSVSRRNLNIRTASELALQKVS